MRAAQKRMVAVRGENAQTVYRTERKAHFTQIPNEALRDERLSWRARGLLGYMLSFPDDWSHRAADIEQHGTEGREAVRAALRELEALGYRTKVKERGEGGRIRTVIVLRDHSTDDRKPVGRSAGDTVDRASLEHGDEHGHEETPSGTEVEQPALVDVPVPPKPRARDAVFDALAAVYPSTTKGEQSVIAVTAAALKKLDPVPEPEEIMRRARAAKREWPDSTARVVETRWTDLGVKARGGTSPTAKFDEQDDEYEARKRARGGRT